MESKNRSVVDMFVLSIVTIAYIGLAVETILLGWEFWVVPLLVIGVICMWLVYIPGRILREDMRSLLFIFGMLACFFHGVHKSSIFDVVVVTAIGLTVYSLFDHIYMLNIIVIEFVTVMLMQVYMNHGDNMTDVDALLISRIILHSSAVICIYMFCRLTVKRRNTGRADIEKREKASEEDKRDMEDFLSNISHELRTPVNVVNGMSQLFLKNEHSDEVEAIYGAGLRLSHQIEDIQDYMEIKRDEITLEEDKYMTMSLIHDVVANYHLIADRDDLELVVDLDPRIPSMMKGDVKKIHKIFRHLLSNAIKFTRNGGVYIKVSSVKREYGINLTIEVSDTGIGMTRKDIASVSKGMYQANKKRNRSTGGIGIGLPIVYGFAHKMKGVVKIESTKGAGTSVKVSIPQQIIDSSNCLSLREDFTGDIVFFTDPGKYKVPVLREFYKSMAVNIAKGLGVRLFSASTTKDVDNLLDKLKVSYVFMGQEEYEQNSDYMEELCEKGYKVAVSAFKGFDPGEDSKIKVMPKPLYGIPVVKILNNEDVFDDEKNEQKKLSLAGLTALVVDDEPMNLVVATGLFREYKLFTDTASSGKESLQRYEKEPYDIIFMDHMMPEMDGVEAMKKIREIADRNGRSPIIIALTANALSGAREMFIEEGFDGFIAKPIDVSDFERVMRNVIPDIDRDEEGRANA